MKCRRKKWRRGREGEIQDTCCYVVWSTRDEEVNFTGGKKKSYMRYIFPLLIFVYLLLFSSFDRNPNWIVISFDFLKSCILIHSRREISFYDRILSSKSKRFIYIIFNRIPIPSNRITKPQQLFESRKFQVETEKNPFFPMIAVQISTRIGAQQGGFVCSSLARLR